MPHETFCSRSLLPFAEVDTHNVSWRARNGNPAKNERKQGEHDETKHRGRLGIKRALADVLQEAASLWNTCGKYARYWKATMEYHKTKDLLHTMTFLGHKKSDNTILYIQLDQKLFKDGDDTFMTRIAHNAQEACGLIEVGFDYITGEYNDGGKIFRKRK